jgi:two-component system nitrogen regulation sensor histidine kinase NtrY
MFLPNPGKKSNRPEHPVRFERRLLFSILLTGVPSTVLAFVLLWANSYALYHKIEGTVILVLFWIGLSYSTRDTVIHSIRVLSNVISSLKEEDFSFRATRAVSGDALGELAIEINSLARALESERLGAMDAANLLRKVLSEVDAVILAFDPDGAVKLINHAGCSFLGIREEAAMNRKASELGIEDLVDGPPSETITRFGAGIEKRWIVRRGHFRRHGLPHRLLMLSEASEALRAEERVAWQRLVRVLSHEINNSLAPIKSITYSLGRMFSTEELPEDKRENLRAGLDVIGSRTDALNRFLQSYARLSRLPPPVRRSISLGKVIQHIAELESRVRITVLSGPVINVNVDQDQLEQALINLTRNAVDAVLMKSESMISDHPVTISWNVNGNDLEIWIRDDGIGLLDTSNLFVPFYTTKQTGSGIGLLLSRQIIEAHNGRLMIRNRKDSSGCEVEIRLVSCVVSEPALSKQEHSSPMQAKLQ